MRTTRSLWAATTAALLLVCLGTSWPALAQETQPAPETLPAELQTIIDVRVAGNRQMTPNAILASVRTRVGQTFDETVAKDDERRLLQTGRFSNVVIVKAQTDQGVIVTFSVSERDTITAIRFRGNRKFREGDLRKDLTFREGDAIDPSRIEIGRAAIEKKYRDKNYYFVSVKIDPEALRQRNQVVFDIVENARIRVDKLVFVGNKSYSSLRLEFKVKTSQAFWFFTRGKLDDQQLAEDVVALRNFYREEGYLDAEVARRLDFSTDKQHVKVVFIIEEGPRYRVNDVQFTGNTIYASPELLARLKMAQADFYTAQGLRRDTETLRDAYGEIGFIDAVITPRTRYVDPTAPAPSWLNCPPGQKPALVNVVYDIRENDQFRIGRITIRGNTITQDRVIRRQMRFFPEQLFNTVAVKESHDRLMETRLFENVTITPYGNETSVRDALVNVQEGPTAEFVVGVGYSTNDGILGRISFAQRNFDYANWPTSWNDFVRGQGFKGAGQTLRITLEPGVELMRARVDWREPFLFDRPVSLDLGAYFFTRERETYDESRIGFQPALGKMFKNKWYAELAGRVEDVRIDDLDHDAPSDVRDVAGDNFLAGLKGTLVRDKTDSRWLPSQGDRLSVSYEQVSGDFTFGKAEGTYSIYCTPYMDALDRKHILAGRLSADSIVMNDAPTFERYYAGGIGSIRGFRFRGISPRQAGSDQPVGGDLSLFAGTEYSYPIYAEVLRGVFFLDSGTVERHYEITSWRTSVGFGLRLQLPFFGPVPMALDFGFPITKNSEDDTQLVSFSFGWVF